LLHRWKQRIAGHNSNQRTTTLEEAWFHEA
jgi:hypothetical protein